MGRPLRIFLEDDDPRYQHWIRKGNRYGRLLKRAEKLDLASGKKHSCVPIEVDGEHFDVLGDPNMSAETRQALAEMIRAAIRAIENGEIGKHE